MVAQKYLYLLASQAEYQQALANDRFWRSSLVEEGFIHASPKHQLERVANKHYQQVVNLLVLQVQSSQVKAEIKWEVAAGDIYPHIYGELNMDAVVSVQAISLNEQGKFDLRWLAFAED